jgi:hypothetical protein
MGSIQSIASLCVMVLLRHTSNKLQNLDYDKIPFQKVQFLSITFNGDVLFKLPLFFPTLHMPLQMQGMDRKYNGHVWNKVITTNILKKLGLILGRLVAWATCVVCKMSVSTLYYVLLVMKYFGVVSANIF